MTTSRVLSLLAALHCARADDALTAALSAVQFLHTGVVNATSSFSTGHIACGYLEPENVTAYLSGWGEGGSCPYTFVSNATGPPPPVSCNPSAVSPNTDRPGSDLAAAPIASDNITLCVERCCETDGCVAWVYAPSAPANFLDCTAGDHCCFLKSSVPDAKPLAGIFSGTNAKPPRNDLVPPPIGVRSAVPLGGLGAGSFELRADGSFHEVTIHNAHPSGAAKYGVLADALLGVRVTTGAASVTRAVRTAPPAYAADAAAAALAYSGSYPVSRLEIRDAALDAVSASVLAYSVFKPGSESEFAHPAVTFSLLVTNAGAAEATAELYFALPWGSINDCDRTGDGSTVTATAPAPDARACLATCAAAGAACAAWTFAPVAGGGGTCSLTRDAPWSRFRAGYACAVAGAWMPTGAAGEALTFVANGNGAPDARLQPGLGDVTLRAVGADAARADVDTDAGALWAAFAAGNLGRGTALGNATAAGVGAVAASVIVPAGASATVSIVFAWHFPDKDWWHERVGNFYDNLWADSSAVAAELAADGRLASVVSDINAHHTVFLGPPAGSPLPASPVPDWLRDTLVNQFSHFRSMHFLRDGRMREYEANDCPDIDSVHNDYQRHLPYSYAAPAFELSKFDEYAAGQLPDGHIPEYLGAFGLGPLDQTGGRTMADTTTLWIVELYEMYINTGDLAVVEKYWPNAVAAIKWQIGACEQIGLPWRLVCTYDIIDFQQYNTSAFNSFVHLAAMRAAGELARAVGDVPTAAAADAAFARGQGALDTVLFNTTFNYYRAYTGADALMGDTLYGQVVALHHGLGWLTAGGDAGRARLAAHLVAELKYNGNAFGLRVVTGRNDPPPADSRFARAAAAARPFALGVDTTDDVNWQGAGPDWSYIAIQLARASWMAM